MSLELLKEVGAWCILDGENNKELSVIMNILMLFVSMLDFFSMPVHRSLGIPH